MNQNEILDLILESVKFSFMRLTGGRCRAPKEAGKPHLAAEERGVTQLRQEVATLDAALVGAAKDLLEVDDANLAVTQREYRLLRSLRSKAAAQLASSVATLLAANSEQIDPVDNWLDQLKEDFRTASSAIVKRRVREFISRIDVWTRPYFRGKCVWYRLDRAVIQFTDAFANRVVRCPEEMPFPASARDFPEGKRGRPISLSADKPPRKRTRKE